MPHRYRVLVVDDDPDLRGLMQVMLESEGCEVVTAPDGAEGLRCARALEPNLIVLDLMMPVLDGWGFRAEQLGDPRISKIPVVVTTAAPEKQARAAALRPQAFLRKPLDFDAFTALVRRLRPRRRGPEREH